MKKIMFLTMIVLVLPFLSSCQKTTKEEQAPLTSETALDKETTTLTSESAQPTEVQTTQSQPQGEIQVSTSQTAPPKTEEALSSPSVLEKPTVESIQQALKNAGLYVGSIDGILGPKTQKAIEDFQAQSSLVVDGKVGPKTWQKLSAYLNQEPNSGSSDISN